MEKAYHDYFQAPRYEPHPNGLEVARQAIAAFYAQQNFKVAPENILICSGTSESFLHLFSLLASPGDNFLAPNPAYPLFDYIARMAHVELRHYQLVEERNWFIDLDDLFSKADSRTKGIILISPNNPTGAVHLPAELRELVAWANQRGISLICDEVFSEFYFGEGLFPRPATVAAPELAFTLGGISKMFALPALKLGWIAVTGETGRVAKAVDQLEIQNDTFLTCHTPIQEALPALFQEGQGFVKDYRETVCRRLDTAQTLLGKIPGLRCVPPRGGFYLMAEILESKGLSEEDWVIRLMEETGVFVHPGYFYDYERGMHLVISFLTREIDLETGISAIGQFLK